MADIGAFIGALVAIGLLSRLALWALKRMGDTPARVLVAHGVTLCFATIAAGYGFADAGGPRFGYALTLYGLATLIVLVLDLLGVKGRQTKRQAAD
jgi:hypothetical protein